MNDWSEKSTKFEIPTHGTYEIEAVDYASGIVVRRQFSGTKRQAELEALNVLNEAVRKGYDAARAGRF